MHTSKLSHSLLTLILVGATGACSAGGSTSTGATSNEDGGGGAGQGPTSTTSGGAQGPGTGGGGSAGVFMGTGGSPTPNGCDSGPDEDKDADGFSVNAGDCNDCDKNVNPGAIEVIGMDDGSGGAGGYVPADEDCDGEADNVAGACDDGLDITGTNPLDGARAIELCKQASGPQDWGVVSAQWVRANGNPATVNGHMGLLDGFGTNVLNQAGSRLLAISSGAARDASDPGACVSSSCTYNGAGTPPPGFPQNVNGCQGGSNINDDVALDLVLRAPTNATGYKFGFKFYSFEYPEWVCTTFNDQFIALVNPPPQGSVNGNISFDSQNNPVSVNVAFFDVCQGCPAGVTELQGTGFGDGEGATSWLQTQAPITGGDTFSIRFATWDTGDTALDSTTLIDNFEWIANGGTVSVGTTPIPQ
jgi:hypothetical protein